MADNPEQCKGKFTPGPWRIGLLSGTVVSDKPSRHYDTYADVQYWGGHLMAESIAREADAHLIAAAPELYAAARNAARRLRYHLVNAAPFGADVVADLEAALAKADGKGE